MWHRLLFKFGPDSERSDFSSPAPISAPLRGPADKPPSLFRCINSPAVIFFVAFGVRLGVMVYMQSFQIEDDWKFGFETGRIARSIASGEGFSSPLQEPSGPTAWLPPIYPYILAGIFSLFGIYTTESALVALSLNAMFSALTCLTIFYFGLKVFGPQVGVWSSWGWAFFPYAVFWSTNWVWATSLSAFLFSLVCLVAVHLERAKTAATWLAFGGLWGVIALTDTALVSILPFLLGWLYYRLKPESVPLGRVIGACSLGFVLVTAPWLIRNYLTFDEFVFVKSNFGLELRLGNYEGSTGLSAGRLLHPAGNERQFEKFRQMGELAYIKETQREALEFIVVHPGTFLWLTLRRFVYFWTGNPQLLQIFTFSGRFVTIRYVFFTTISILAFLGLLLGLRNRNPAVALFTISVLVFPVVYYIAHPTPRYRHTIEPALVVLAVYAMTNLFSGLSLQKGTRLIFSRDSQSHCTALCTQSPDQPRRKNDAPRD